MRCPKCGSEKIEIVDCSYPYSCECKNCGHQFIKPPQALIDE